MCLVVDEYLSISPIFVRVAVLASGYYYDWSSANDATLKNMDIYIYIHGSHGTAKNIYLHHKQTKQNKSVYCFASFVCGVGISMGYTLSLSPIVSISVP